MPRHRAGQHSGCRPHRCRQSPPSLALVEIKTVGGQKGICSPRLGIPSHVDRDRICPVTQDEILRCRNTVFVCLVISCGGGEGVHESDHERSSSSSVSTASFRLLSRRAEVRGVNRIVPLADTRHVHSLAAGSQLRCSGDGWRRLGSSAARPDPEFAVIIVNRHNQLRRARASGCSGNPELGPRNGAPTTRASQGVPRGDERIFHLPCNDAIAPFNAANQIARAARCRSCPASGQADLA